MYSNARERVDIKCTVSEQTHTGVLGDTCVLCPAEEIRCVFDDI